MKNYWKYRPFDLGCALLILVICLSPLRDVNAQNVKDSSSFFIIQLSDPQIGFFQDSIQVEMAAYKKAVDEINRLNPDFVVITGDLIHHSKNRQELSEFKHVTSLVNPDIPVFYTPGNHDVENDPRQKDLDYYKSIYGYDRFSFEHKGVRFIGFNSSLVSKNVAKPLRREQFRWLKAELRKSKQANNIVVFCHIPLFINNPNEPDLYYDKEKTERKNMQRAERKKYLKLLDRYHVTAVFAGHLHQNAYGEYKKIKMVTTSAVGQPLGTDPRGLRVIVLNKDKTSFHYYSLDSVPDHINMKD